MKKQSRKFFATLSLILAFVIAMGAAPLDVFSANGAGHDEWVDYFKDAVYDYSKDAYAYGYQYAVKNGYIDDAIAEIDGLMEEIKALEVQIPEDLPEEIPEEIPEDWPEEIPEDWMEQIPEDLLNQIPEDLLNELLNKYGHGTQVPQPAAKARATARSTTNEYVEFVAYAIQLKEEIQIALNTLEEMKAILNGNELSTFDSMVETLREQKDILRDRFSRIQILWVLLAEDPDRNIDYDTILQALDTADKAEYELENNVMPAVDKALKAIAEASYDPLTILMETFLDREVNSDDALIGALEEVSKMSEEEITAILEELIDEATHEEYEITNDSFYVAFGNVHDSRDSYAKRLAGKLDVDYKNYSWLEKSLEEFSKEISTYTTDIEKADLISLNFGEVASLADAISEVSVNGTNYDIDWAQYLGENGDELAEKVDKALAALSKELAANGVDKEMADTVISAVEMYAYQYVAHMFSLHEVVSEIKIINPDAVIVVVGAYNPLSNVTYNHNGTIIEFSEYLNYLFDAFRVYDLAYAIITEDVTYVDAPAVDIKLEATELDRAEALRITLDSMQPSADGFEYIKEEIWNALIITVNKVDPENPDCEHQYGTWTITEKPSCIKEGIESRVCALCGHVDTRKVDKVPHDWHWVIDTDEGVKYEECRVCGEQRNKTELPTDPVDPEDPDCEHQYGEWTITEKPSCIKEGIESRICELCGHVDTRKVDKVPHDWHWVIDEEATKDKDGLKHEECKVCGEKRNEGTVIPKLETPPTSDNLHMVFGAIAIVAVVAAGAVVAVIIFKRRRSN